MASTFLAFLAPGAWAQATSCTSTTTKLFITDKDGLTSPSIVRGASATVYVRLIDTAASTNTIFPDTIRAKASSREAATTPTVFDPGWEFNLLETGPQTGIFLGSFRVKEVSLPTDSTLQRPQQNHSKYREVFGDGLLGVKSGGHIKVERVGTAADCDEAQWFNAADSVVQVRNKAGASMPAGQAVQGYGDILRFNVTDPDLNTAGLTVQTHSNLLFVSSDSDPGEFIPLAESTIPADPTLPPVSSADSPVFAGQVGFEVVAQPNNGKLMVQHGDRIRATLVDSSGANGQTRTLELPAPNAQGVAFWPFVVSSDGVAVFAVNEFNIPDANSDGLYDLPAVVFVFDPDQSLNSSAPDEVMVNVWTSPTPPPAGFLPALVQTITLQELGGLSGQFFADVRLACLGASCPAGTPTTTQLQQTFGSHWLQVVHGETLNLRFNDEADALGVPRERTHSAPFFSTQTARVTLGPAGGSPVTILAGTTGQHNVEVIDSDANRDVHRAEEVTVRVKSSTDPTSLNLVLREDADSSSRFVGTFRFTTGTAGPNELRASDRDLVQAEYNDPLMADGGTGIIRSNRVTWRAATTATVAFDATSYVKRFTDVTKAPDFGQRATMIVLDQDQNDPFRTDSVQVNLQAVQTKRSTAYTATETGPDSGIFLAEANFGPMGSFDNAGRRRFDPGESQAGVVFLNADGTPMSVPLVIRESSNPADAATATVFKVHLASRPNSPVTIVLSSSDSSEGCVSKLGPDAVPYACSANPETALRFLPNDPVGLLRFTEFGVFTQQSRWDVDQSVEVKSFNDDLEDGAISFAIVTGVFQSQDPSFGGLEVSDVPVRNDDDDTTRFLFSTTSLATTEDPGDAATFSVHLSRPPPSGTQITFAVQTTDASEGTVSPASLTFNSTNWNTPHVVTVTPEDDADLGGTHVYAIVTGVATESGGPASGFAGIDPNDVIITQATNDDDPTPADAAIIVEASGVTTTEDQLDAETSNQFTVVLNRQPTANVDVPLATSSTEGCIVSGNACTVARTLRFTTQNWFQPQTVTVRGRNDTFNDGNTVYTIEVRPAQSTDTDYNGKDASDVGVTNLNDFADISVSAVLGKETREGPPLGDTGVRSFTVVLNQKPTFDVVLPLSVSSPSEARIESPSSCNFISPPRPCLSFTPTSWNVPQTVLVGGLDDGRVDGNLRYTIVLGAPLAMPDGPDPGTDPDADPAYSLLDPNDVSFTNLDDEDLDLVAEYGDPLTSAGTAQLVSSPSVKWIQNAVRRFIRFENVVTGERVNLLSVSETGRGSDNLQLQMAAYGSFGGGSLLLHVTSSLCPRTVAIIELPVDEAVTLAQDPTNPNRYSAVLTVLRPPPNLSRTCRNDRIDRTIYAAAGDTISAHLLPELTTIETVAVRALVSPPPSSSGPNVQQETFTLIDPKTGLARATPDYYGTQEAAVMRVFSRFWNQDSTAIDVAYFDVYHSGAGGFNDAFSNSYQYAVTPPLRVIGVETGTNTNTFDVSFGFQPYSEVRHRQHVRTSHNDFGLPLTPMSQGAFLDGNLCFADVDGDGQPRIQADSGDPVDVVYRTLRKDCSRAEIGDLHLALEEIAAPLMPRARFGPSSIGGLSAPLKVVPLMTDPDPGKRPKWIRAPSPNDDTDELAIYLDLDGNRVVSFGDIEMAQTFDSGDSGNDEDVDIQMVMRVLDDNPTSPTFRTLVCDASNFPCGQGVPLFADASVGFIGNESYFDRNRNGRWDYSEPVYFDIDKSGTITGGDYRLTRAAGLASDRVSVRLPGSPYGLAVPSARILVDSPLPVFAISGDVETPQTWQTAFGGLNWFDAQDPAFLPTPGVALTPPILEIQDDASSGYVYREQHTPGGGSYPTGATFTARAGSIHPEYPFVYVVRTERAQRFATTDASQTQPSYVVEAFQPKDGGNGAFDPIVDRNLDGIVTCADLTFAAPAGSVCRNVDPGLGAIYFTCGGGAAQCTVDVTYMYLADLEGTVFDPGCPTDATDNPDCNVFNYIVTQNQKVVFGANIPTDHVLFFTYRPKDIKYPVRSQQGGELELIPFSLPDAGGLRRNYLGTMPVELTPTANNGILHVVPGLRASDKLRLAYPDNRLANGATTPPNDNHFLTQYGFVSWFNAVDAAVEFYDASFTTKQTQTTSGPFVAIQVTNPESDISVQPDTITVTARNGGRPADRIDGLVLRETEARSGVFRGVIPAVKVATETAADLADGALNFAIVPGSIVVSFTDPFLADGRSAAVTSNIAWKPADKGQLVVCDAPIGVNPDGSFNLPASCPQTNPISLRGTEAGLFLGVRDPDRNLDSFVRDIVNVVVTSQSDSVGETIPLQETSVNTGVFLSAAVRFEAPPATPAAVPDNGRVFVRDPQQTGEPLRVGYLDPIDDFGVPKRIEQTPRVTWRPAHDGIVSFDQAFYIGLEGQGATGTILDATVYVQDRDLNKDPNVVDRSSLAPSNNAFVEIGLLTGASTSLDHPMRLQLFEVGANSGIFMETFTFDAGVTSTPAAPAIHLADGAASGKLGMGNVLETVQLEARYTDDATAAQGGAGDSRGSTRTFSAEVPWFRKGVGVVRFDRPGYNDRALQPILRLWDADLDIPTGTAQELVTVRVRSETNAAGIAVVLKETATHSGIFSTATGTGGSFKLTVDSSRAGTATAIGEIAVATLDNLTVTYNDASPAAIRTHTAGISIGDFRSPTTTMVVDPEEPDGRNDYYLVDPLIDFVTDELVETTFFRVGGGAAPEEFGGPFQLAARFGEGTHEIKFWSIDLFGNQEADPSATVKVDLTNPSQRVVGLKGSPGPGGTVQLNWSNVPLLTDPLEFFDYAVFRDGNSTAIGNTTTNAFTDIQLTDEMPHTYRVAVRDESGRVGPLSDLVSVTPDRTVPTLSSPVVSPSTFDNRSKPSGIQVAVTAQDANLAKVRATLVLPSGEVIAEIVLQPVSGSPNVFSGLLPVADVTQPCTCTLNFTGEDKAGNIGSLAVPYRITGPDAVPPEFTLTGPAADGSLVLGQPIQVRVTDNVGLTGVTYAVDTRASVAIAVDPPEANTVDFEVATAGLSLGIHTLRVEAMDTARTEEGALAPNLGNATLQFTLVSEAAQPPEGPPGGIAGNFFLATRATPQPDGTVLVEWDVPQSVVAQGVAGFQVWRAASPFALIANVTDPGARSFVDNASVPGRVYRYVVTYFTSVTGAFASLSQVPGYPGSDEKVQGSGPIKTKGEGVPAWVWIVVAALAVMAVAVLVAVVLASRRPAGTQVLVQEAPPAPVTEEPLAEEAPAAAVEPGERHRMRCPECDHMFEVVGRKPIVTNCPNCGRKGILR